MGTATEQIRVSEAVKRELDAPVVSADRDLTDPRTKAVVDVEEY